MPYNLLWHYVLAEMMMMMMMMMMMQPELSTVKPSPHP